MKKGFKVNISFEALDEILRSLPAFKDMENGEIVSIDTNTERDYIIIKYRSDNDNLKIGEFGEYPCRPTNIITTQDVKNMFVKVYTNE